MINESPTFLDQQKCQLVGLRGNLKRKPWLFPANIDFVLCRFPLKPMNLWGFQDDYRTILSESIRCFMKLGQCWGALSG